ncbi:MAG: ABC transporter ATP-binding protein, partial [Chloroflexi bacterium]|nr:ABC transporter ATP-binding protein [Chloroflexota bacterium]
MMVNTGTGGNWVSRGQQGDIDEDGTKLYDQRVILRLLSYVVPYKFPVFLAMMAVVVYTGATVAIPLIIAIGIDRYIENGDLSGLNTLAVWFGVVLVVHYAANYAHQVLLARVSQRVIYDLRNDLFKHLQDLPMSFHNRHKVGSVMSRAQNDVYQLQEFLDIVVLSIGDLLSLSGIIAFMLARDWQLSLLSFASLPVLMVIIWVWQKHARPAFLRVRVAISQVNASLAENLDGVRVVQSMNRQRTNMGAFDELNDHHLQTNLRAQRLASSLMPVVEMFMSFSLAATIIFGGRLVLGGALGA